MLLISFDLRRIFVTHSRRGQIKHTETIKILFLLAHVAGELPRRFFKRG